MGSVASLCSALFSRLRWRCAAASAAGSAAPVVVVGSSGRCALPPTGHEQSLYRVGTAPPSAALHSPANLRRLAVPVVRGWRGNGARGWGEGNRRQLCTAPVAGAIPRLTMAPPILAGGTNRSRMPVTEPASMLSSPPPPSVNLDPPACCVNKKKPGVTPPGDVLLLMDPSSNAARLCA